VPEKVKNEQSSVNSLVCPVNWFFDLNQSPLFPNPDT
jgi:hypothetical protein